MFCWKFTFCETLWRRSFYFCVHLCSDSSPPRPRLGEDAHTGDALRLRSGAGPEPLLSGARLLWAIFLWFPSTSPRPAPGGDRQPYPWATSTVLGARRPRCDSGSAHDLGQVTTLSSAASSIKGSLSDPQLPQGTRPSHMTQQPRVLSCTGLSFVSVWPLSPQRGCSWPESCSPPPGPRRPPGITTNRPPSPVCASDGR